MIGAKMKIALLYDVWNEDPVAAAAKQEPSNGNGNGNGNGRKPHKPVKKAKKEKTDREEIFEALQKLGHEPSSSNWMADRSRCIRWQSAMPISSST